MSKFVAKLTHLNKDIVPPLGFSKSPSMEEKPESILVMVELEGKKEEEIKALAEAGAAAGLVKGLKAGMLTKLVGCSLPIGLVLDSDTMAGPKIANGEIDFIIFRPGLPLRTLEGWALDQKGKIIELNSTIDSGLLHSVNNLYPGVDAVLVDLTMASLTVEHMMSCRRVADFSGQPLIARTSSVLSGAELAALREAGVKCLLLDATATIEEVKALGEAIRGLPRPPRKGPKDVALVPIVGLGPEQEEEGGGDDEDDN